jgi:hypothetical protein
MSQIVTASDEIESRKREHDGEDAVGKDIASENTKGEIYPFFSI